MRNARYAFVKANWHSEIVDRSLDGFREIIPADSVDVFDVPGAFELPLMARDLARSGKYQPSLRPPSSPTVAYTAMSSWRRR
jgi:6,7-dimethyl-8-ribityllumazine synthase